MALGALNVVPDLPILPVVGSLNYTLVNGMTQFYIPFGAADGSLTENADLLWNGINLQVGGGGIFNINNEDKDFKVYANTAGNAVVYDAGSIVWYFEKTAIFNNAGGDFDFNIKGATENNLFYVDASANRIGIGTNTPSAVLDVVGDTELNGDLEVNGQELVDHDTTGTVTENLLEVYGELQSTTEDTTMNFFYADMQNGSSYPSAGTQWKTGYTVNNVCRGNQTGGTYNHLGGYFNMGSLAELPSSALAVDHDIIGLQLHRGSLCVGDLNGGSWNDVTGIGLKLTGWENAADDSAGIAGTFTRYAIYSDGGNVELTDGDLATTGTITGINVSSGANPGHTHTGASLSDIDISEDTNLVDGTNITLVDDTLNVDDAFLVNDASDETSGTITAAGFTTTGTVQAEHLYTTDDLVVDGLATVGETLTVTGITHCDDKVEYTDTTEYIDQESWL